jgi:hypothetical protein
MFDMVRGFLIKIARDLLNYSLENAKTVSAKTLAFNEKIYKKWIIHKLK